MRVENVGVLVIGSGGAGLRTAIELQKNKVDVLVVGKCERRDAHTVLATGGINAAFGNMDPKDSWQLHAADTIRDGEHINDPIAVGILCKNALGAVRELSRWGCLFHREKNGKITQRFFGAATYRRACFVGDKTGKAILNTLVDQALKRKIRFKSEIYIVSLLENKGKVNGAIGLDLKKGELICFQAKVVVLCTGGHSRIFKRCSSRFWENNGDGIYLGWEVNASFMDMEMFQFHPTGMVWPLKAEGILVTEAVRGEGGILLNSKGERFMKRYDPERMDLSARDIVARANYNEIKNGRGTKHGAVYLDITSKSKRYIKKRLPRMYEQFRDFAGIDISEEKMEVAPTAHYSMGGLLVDYISGRTSVGGLYAVGEVTAGLHGGNRLGGNSLAELMVFGRLVGQRILKDLKKSKEVSMDYSDMKKKQRAFGHIFMNKSGKNPIKVKIELQKMMWKAAGVVRNEKDLQWGLKQLEKYKKIKLKTGKNLIMNKRLIAALDVRNMIPACEMILLSALYRRESRAAHYRSDFPKLNSSWQKNVVCVPKKEGFRIKTRPVSKVPAEINRLLTRRKVESDSSERHMLE